MSENPNDHCKCELKVGDSVHVPARIVSISASDGDKCELLLETERPCHDGHESVKFVVRSHQVEKCHPEAPIDRLKVGHLEAKSICLRSDNGAVQFDLVVDDRTGGLWLKGADGTVFALYTSGESRGFGYYSAKSIKKGGAMDFAISLDDEGRAYLQLADAEGNPVIFTAGMLFQLIEAHVQQANKVAECGDGNGGCGNCQH